MHSNLKVAFEVNLSSEGEMDANYVNNTYHITDTFFGSTMLYKTYISW